jgi:uncharacterized protein YggE
MAQETKPMWHKSVAGVLGLVLILYVAVLIRNEWRSYDYIGRSDQQIYTISVSGEGKVTAVPDIAQISLGVETQKSDVATAQKENTTKVNDLIASLKDMDIDEKDIQTANYNISPVYDYNNGQQTLRGYQISQSVMVKIRKLDTVGDIVAKAGSLGANQIGGLNFTMDDPEALQQQAREKALVNAKEKAQALANVAGAKLGKLVSFSESGMGMPMPIMYAKDMAMAQEGRAAVTNPAPDIQPGSQDIIINVSVMYEVL